LKNQNNQFIPFDWIISDTSVLTNLTLTLMMCCYFSPTWYTWLFNWFFHKTSLLFRCYEIQSNWFYWLQISKAKKRT